MPTRFSFQNQNVLITGGSSGIGLALARLLLTEGARVCVVSRRPVSIKKALRELKKLSGSSERVAGFAVDVTSYRQFKNAYRKYCKTIGTPNILINCAGIAEPGYFQQLTLRSFYRQMETNYYGTVHTTKAIVSDWLGSKQRGGVIVNVASVAGLLGVFGYSGYCPSKYAVVGFSEALRQELKPHGIRVHLVCPPDTDTPGLAHENQTKPYETRALSGTASLLEADRVARSILEGVRRNRYIIFSNFDSRWIYGLSRWLPGLSRWIMDAMIRRAQKRHTS